MKKQHVKPSKFGTVALILAVVLVLLAVSNAVLIWNFGVSVNQKYAEEKEKARPADLTLTIISVPDCTDCFDISALVNRISSSNAKIVSEKTIGYKSPEAAELIRTYNLERLPTVVVTGETTKSKSLESLWNSIGRLESDDTAVAVQGISPVFWDVKQNRFRGRVEMTTIETDCTDCYTLDGIINFLTTSTLKITKTTNLKFSDPAAKTLMQKYNITKLPSLVLSSEASVYPDLVTNWASTGSVEPDGSLIFRSVSPPFVDPSGVVRGRVTAVFLNDSSCTECYDVTIHRQILSRFGLSLSNETTLDVSSEDGRALLAKYNITKVPTFVLSSEASAYPALAGVWPSVGTIESDGRYVFREISVIQAVYKDLSSGKLLGTSTQ